MAATESDAGWSSSADSPRDGARSAVPVVPRDIMLTARGLTFHLREWLPATGGDGAPFLLLHGLASNARTWDAVGWMLASAGHAVWALDQRGHGLSDKPESGYGFDDVTADLRAVVDALGVERPIVAGQSWGGNVVLDFAARYPDVAAGLVLVDGGFSELSTRPGATWESISVALRPPPLVGLPRAEIEARIRGHHPDWADEGIAGTLANFETMSDDTIRPHLTLERHMAILRALWEHHPTALYPQIAAPTLLAAAGSGDDERQARKREGVALAERSIPRGRSRWFAGADHDIHAHRPAELAAFVLAAIGDGFFD